jgi:hypothetical protein
MVAFVVICNVLIGLVCLIVAWQIWRLKSTIAAITRSIVGIEQAVYDVLHPAPEVILKGQSGTAQLRQNYQNLGPQLERLERILAIVNLGRTVWVRRSPTALFRRRVR